jgi:hypothetical protein
MTCTLHKDLYTFMIISRWILVRMINTSDKSCRENQNTHFIFIYSFSGSYTVYEIMCKKYGTVIQARNDSVIRRMRFACWITKATDTQSEHVIHIAFPLQQWFRDSWVLCWYVRCLSFTYIFQVHFLIKHRIIRLNNVASSNTQRQYVIL